MEEQLSFFDHLIKVLILGDQAVGKTCIMLRFSDNKFASSHIATIGIDFKVKMLQVDQKNIKMQIWDTAGQERFRNIARTFYKGAQGVILTYDCTRRESFENIREWIHQISQHASKDIFIVLAANKCDMSQSREVSKEEGESLAESVGVPYFDVSAKSGFNVESIFEIMCQQILERGNLNNGSVGKRIENKSTEKKKKGCCKG